MSALRNEMVLSLVLSFGLTLFDLRFQASVTLLLIPFNIMKVFIRSPKSKLKKMKINQYIILFHTDFHSDVTTKNIFQVKR